MMGDRLKQLREEHNMSQAEVGEYLGITQQSVFAWERGKTVPGLQVAFALCDLYRVSLDYLLGRSDVNTYDIKKEPAISDDELRGEIVSRVRSLSDPALVRVVDFLDGLEAGQAIGRAASAAPGSDLPRGE